MDIELQIAILGIIGTIGGTILGWFLNNLSQKGKLDIFISSWKDEFKYYNKSGLLVKSSSIEQTENYLYELSMDLYNSSGNTKIMRNIEIVFAKDNSELKISVPKDNDTEKVLNKLGITYDDIKPINIPPKSVKKITVHDNFKNKNSELNFIWETNNVFLRYVNEKNKVIVVAIKKENYKDYFNNHELEE